MAAALALPSAVAYGFADFAGGLAARRSSVVTVTVVAQAAGLVVLVPGLLLVGDPMPDTPQLPSAGPVRPPQVDALTADTALVTLTVGGNDVHYLLDMLRHSCGPEDGVLPPELCAPPDPAWTDAALAALPGRMRTLLEVVRARAPRARILVVDYATILPADACPCPGIPLSAEQMRYSLGVGERLRRATAEAAARGGAELVAFSRASRDHHACSAEPWVNGWFSGPAGGQYHPNAAGMRAAADLVVASLTARTAARARPASAPG